MVRRWIWVILAIGCSDYGIEGKPPIEEPSSSTTTPPTTPPPPPDQDCELKPQPGPDAAYNEDCHGQASAGTFTPIVEWSDSTFPGPLGNEVMSEPIVVSVNDDNGDGLIDQNDTPDIVVVTYDNSNYSTGGILRALDGRTGTQLWATAGTGIEGTGGVAGGDLDGDGIVELVSLTPSGAVAFENDGTVKWTNTSLSGLVSGTSDVPAISDMDHDGRPEIIAGRAILDGATGTVEGVGAYGMGGVQGYNVGSCPFAADIDGDGIEEVITGNAAYNPDGSTKWYNGLEDGYPAVADFNGDGQAEVVVSGQGTLRMLHTDGTQIWSISIPGAGSPGYGGPPTIADFDGDGQPEIGVAAGSEYSVVKRDGTLLWQHTTDDSSSGNTGSAVFDFEGDGAAEVVYADQTRLWVFSGVDGSVKLESTQHSNGTWMEYSVIADVDGDGHVEIVVPNEEQWGGYTGITVFGDANDSWQAGRKIWNQHAYFITNVNDDGTIPQTAAQNWKTYNNFRSGDLSPPDGLAEPDLVATDDVCEIDCSEGRIVVYGWAGNQGISDVTIAQRPVLELYAVENGAERLVDSKPIPADLVAGTYADSVTFNVKNEDPYAWDALIVKIRSDALECDDTNNEARIEGPFCAGTTTSGTGGT